MSKIEWTYQPRELKSLRFNQKNPRRITKAKAELLGESMETFGVCQPIVIQPDGLVIGGHQRVRVLLQKGIACADCAVPSRELDEGEFERLSIMLNKVQGEFDLDMLANQWDETVLLESGFTAEELCLPSSEDEKPTPKWVKIEFQFEESRSDFEQEISMILGKYSDAKMKVSK